MKFDLDKAVAWVVGICLIVVSISIAILMPLALYNAADSYKHKDGQCKEI